MLVSVLLSENDCDHEYKFDFGHYPEYINTHKDKNRDIYIYEKLQLIYK